MSDLVEADKLHDYLATHKVSFFLPPRRWSSAPSIPFDWNGIRLASSERSSVPRAPGVYTLLINPRIFRHPYCSYLAYAGQSGNLWRRFGEYLSRERTVRPRVRKLLLRWDGFILFCFAQTEESELDRLEDILHQHYVPPFNSKYKGTLKRAVGAFTP